MPSPHPKIKTVLFKSKTLSDGRHPVMFRLIFNREVHYLSTGYTAFVQEWVPNPGVLKDNETANRQISRDRDGIANILDKFGRQKDPFSFEEFFKEYRKSNQISAEPLTLSRYTQGLIYNMERRKEFGNASTYRQTINQINKYLGKDIILSKITSKHLENIYTEMKASGLKDTTMHVYFRTLRSIINKAMREKPPLFPREKYPFEDFKIDSGKKFSLKTRKRAISKDAIKLINGYQVEEGTALFHAKNYFMFSYLCRGINFRDMALLKWDNIIDGRLNYSRAKTGDELSIKIQEPVQMILNWYHAFHNDSRGYIFPIITPRQETEKQIFERCRTALSQFNQDIKGIALEVGIEGNITSYVARHSYATILRREGMPDNMISQALSHQDEKTTTNYLDDFAVDELDKMDEKLLE